MRSRIQTRRYETWKANMTPSLRAAVIAGASALSVLAVGLVACDKPAPTTSTTTITAASAAPAASTAAHAGSSATHAASAGSAAASASSAAAPAAGGGDAKKGAYLVMVGGCSDCHTPKKMGAHGPELDEPKLLSGHQATEAPGKPPATVQMPWLAATNLSLSAWSGPWGISFAANITPDPETGIGKWTEAQFIKSIRMGKHLGDEKQRPILPPMPYKDFQQLTDADLGHVFAYLKSIPAVKNKVPQPIPPAKAPAAPPAPAAPKK
jgi:mono/diheme cytochrome c family protein